MSLSGSMPRQSMLKGNNSTDFGMNPKTTITLPYSELLRIKDAISLEGNPEQLKKQHEKLELLEKSKARVQNWPNTLEAKRKKKDEVKFEKFKAEEEQRRMIDEKEAIEQAENRKMVINKANKQIYEQSDRVKAFQSKMLLADALLEREAQQEISRRKKELESRLELNYKEMLLEKIKNDELEEKAKEEQLKVKKEKIKVILRDQHEEMKKRYVKKMQEEKIEGQIIKQKAVEDAQKAVEEEALRREKFKKVLEDTRKGNELLKEMKKENILKEKEEEKKILDYARRKEEIMEMRKRREEEKLREKQEQRQKLIDIQFESLKKIKNNEEQRFNKQVEEVEKKTKELEEKKQKRIQRLKNEINKNNELTIVRKEKEKEREKTEAIKYQKIFTEKNKEIEEKEKKIDIERKERIKNLQKFHQEQKDQKQQERERNFIQELEDSEKMRAYAENEDKVFKSWAERCMKEWQDDGKNLTPMLLELNQYKKKVI